MSRDLRRDFESRDELIAYLKGHFPEAYARDPHISEEFVGGRSEAEKRLKTINPGKPYEKTRNDLDGAVTKLSPYIRYGVLNLAEVRDHALNIAGRSAYKFINELGCRHYWQRLYAQIGDEIWNDQEPYKTGIPAHAYADHLPQDIADSQTGIALIDDIVRDLRETGYLHNRQRMYFAAYVIHWRKIRWQVGARFFLTHLLDGDPASNNLSWQWVASTFSHKPYIFNLDNVRKFTGDRYQAPAAELGMTIFDRSYDDIVRDLFNGKAQS